MQGRARIAVVVALWIAAAPGAARADERREKELARELERMQQAYGEIVKRQAEIAGVVTGGAPVEPERVRADLREARQKVALLLESEESRSEDFRRATTEIRYVRGEAAREYASLREMEAEVIVIARAMQAELGRQQESVAALRRDLEEERARARREKVELEWAVEGLRMERASLQDRLIEHDRQADSEQRELRDELEAARLEAAKREEEAVIAHARDVAKANEETRAVRGELAIELRHASTFGARVKAGALADVASADAARRRHGYAVAALARIADAAPALEAALEKPDAAERLEAARALLGLGAAGERALVRGDRRARTRAKLAAWTIDGAWARAERDLALALLAADSSERELVALAPAARKVRPDAPFYRKEASRSDAVAVLIAIRGAGGDAGALAGETLTLVLDLPKTLDDALWTRCRDATIEAVRANIETARLTSEKMSLSFDKTSVADVAGFIRELNGVKLVPIGEARERAITYSSTGKPLDEALRAAFAAAGLEMLVRRGLIFVGLADDIAAAGRLDDLIALPAPGSDAPPWVLALERILTDLRVTVSFEETPVEDVLTFLQDVSGINVVPLPGLRGKVLTLAIRDVPFGDVFALLCLEVRARAAVRWGAVIVGLPAEVEALGADDSAIEGPTDESEEGRRAAHTLRFQKLSLNFPDLALGEALAFVDEITPLEVVIADGIDVDAVKLHLRARDVAVEDGLRLMLRPHGLTHRVREGKVRIERLR